MFIVALCCVPGTVLVFRMYGIVCVVFLVLFLAVNAAKHDEGAGGAGGGDGDDLDVAPLGPHGVPGAHAIPRALSSSKLEEDGEEDAQMAQAGANLGVPGENQDNDCTTTTGNRAKVL